MTETMQSTQTQWRQPGDTALFDQQVLIDRAAIQDVVHAVGLLFDSGEFAELGELLTADARYEIDPLPPLPPGMPPVASSREEIVTGMSMIWRHNRDVLHVYPRHVVTNVLITRLGADSAEVHSMLTITGTDADDRHELRKVGRYVDLFRREGARWRIAHRRQLMMAPPPLRGPDLVG